jgi:PAS domain S-box-containing protein
MKELSDKFVTNCFWLALVLLCGVCTAFCTSISQLREDKQWVTHTHQVIETLNDVDAKLSNTESARRGSIIATKTSYLLAYKQEKPKIYAKLKTVRYLTKDNFFQQHRLNTLEPLVERRFDLFDKSINSLKTDKVDKVTQVSVTDQGKQLHEQIRYIIDAMVKEEHTLLERRTLQTNSRVRNIVFIGASGSCLSLLLFLTVYKLLQKQIRINGVLSQEAILLEQKAAKTKLVAFLESTTDAFVALDNDWQYIYVNSRAGQIFNRRPEDLIGRNIWEEFPEGIGQKFYQAYHQAMEQQQMIQLEEYFPPWDCWFENRIYPSQEGLSIFFQDITESPFKNLKQSMKS